MNKEAEQLSPNEALSKWKGTEAGQAALSKVSPGELAYGALGALGGGALGYLLSRLHRKKSRGRSLLYALLGAAGGISGSQLLLKNLAGGEGFEGSLRDKMRLSAMPEWTEVVNGDKGSIDKEGPIWRYINAARSKEAFGPGKLNMAAALAGGYGGYKGKLIDFSGIRAQQRAFNELANSSYNGDIAAAWSALKSPRSTKAIRELAGGGRGARQLFENRLKLEQTAPKSGVLRGTGGQRALDTAGNAAAAYLLASALNYGAMTMGVTGAQYNPALDPAKIR